MISPTILTAPPSGSAITLKTHFSMPTIIFRPPAMTSKVAVAFEPMKLNIPANRGVTISTKSMMAL